MMLYATFLWVLVFFTFTKGHRNEVHALLLWCDRIIADEVKELNSMMFEGFRKDAPGSTRSS